ncbi:MAG TPA: type II toxin-antitoxin system PemK/MazF family toxin [Nitrolancea sp.]|nr:type II toxin-antitoxin system PemK/MazF family toxin [Nitrolancea sp.]
MVARRAPARGDVYLIQLDPTRGSEFRKKRPCLVVSPDELNAHLRTVTVAPMTRGGHPYPFRVACRFEKKHGHVVLDQLRTVDSERLVKRLGTLSSATLRTVLDRLQEMFAR